MFGPLLSSLVTVVVLLVVHEVVRKYYIGDESRVDEVSGEPVKTRVCRPNEDGVGPELIRKIESRKG